MSSCEFCEIFKNTFLYGTPLVAASMMKTLAQVFSFKFSDISQSIFLEELLKRPYQKCPKSRGMIFMITHLSCFVQLPYTRRIAIQNIKSQKLDNRPPTKPLLILLIIFQIKVSNLGSISVKDYCLFI